MEGTSDFVPHKNLTKVTMKKGLTHEEALKRIMGKRTNKEDT